MISINKTATKIVEQMIQEEEALGIRSLSLKNGAKIIDAGIETCGGLRAGKYFSEAVLGGLSDIGFSKSDRLYVHVIVDHPAIACMASQYAGWRISVGDYFTMGSGPARALAKVEDIFQELDYEDDSSTAVIALETREIPGEEVTYFIAEKCKVKPADLYVLAAPTASIVGSVQISSRVVETGLHKMHELNFDLSRIISGSGSAPIAPVAGSDLEAMGRTNDCSLYGGRTSYFVDAEDSEIEEIIEDVPSSSSKDYGEPFLEIFERYDRDFYKIDAMLFSPSEVTINNIRTGKIFRSGSVNEELLEKSLGPSD